MHLTYAVPQDIDHWMRLVTRVRWNFPGLETDNGLSDYRNTVLKFISKRQAICVKAEGEIAGVMLFSRGRNMICCLAVSPDFRRRGVASVLMDEALKELDRTREITVSTFRAEDEKGCAPRALYEKYGFIPDELIMEMEYPNQKYVLHPEKSERKARQRAVNSMVGAISEILSDGKPSIYLYGSSALNDFRLGWSDIDLIVLTEKEISDAQAEKLVYLRQYMLKSDPGNPYYRSFEGGMLCMDAFLNQTPTKTVYWGTSGERFADKYMLDSFGRSQLIENSIHLYGKDIRERLSRPDFHAILDDIKRHHETIEKYGGASGRSLYTFGWILDIARCIYTIRSGKLISKTQAAEWALNENLCPDPEALAAAMKVRKDPLMHKNEDETMDYAQTLSGAIRRFNDVLGREIERCEFG